MMMMMNWNSIETINFIGAIFDESNKEAQIAFKHAVNRENIIGGKFSLVPIVQVIDTKNTYLAEQAGK